MVWINWFTYAAPRFLMRVILTGWNYSYKIFYSKSLLQGEETDYEEKIFIKNYVCFNF